jgi:hypothetical protein
MTYLAKMHKIKSGVYGMNSKETGNVEMRGADSDAVAATGLAFSYRRAGRPELAGRKLIKCPYCTELLIDVDRNTLVQVYGMAKEVRGKRRKRIPGLTYRKCSACKGEVGLVMS